MLNMKRGFPVLVLVLAGLAVPAAQADPGPIPTCGGERATHVLVGFHPEDAEPYQSWADAGVSVVTEPDGALLGTTDHDVLVALVSTFGGGIISDPFPASDNPDTLPTAGDTICAGAADDVIYASRGKRDVIFSGGGQDDIYAGGGGDLVKAGAGTDFIWGFKTGPNQTQHLYGGSGQDHFYVGAGEGRVVVDGGPSPTDVNGGGDHIHPCPINSPGQDIDATNIEYIGPESAFTNDPNNPCTYQQRSL